MQKCIPSIAIVASITLLTACNSHTEEVASQPEHSITTVKALTVELAPGYAVDREYVGTVQAGQSANLGFELGGKVNKLLVDEGDTVAKGQPLIKLDTQLLDTEAQQLNAQLEQLDAQLDLTRTNLQRQRQLKKKGFSADAEIDSLISQRDALRANVRQLQASLSSNRLRQEKSTIYAPYNGKISQRFVSQGDVVNVGAPTLTLLADDLKEARIGVPIKYLEVLSSSPSAKVRVGTNTYQATLLNPGVAIDMRSRTVTLRYLLPENANTLDGQLAYLEFAFETPQEGFWMPLSGLTDGLRGTWNVYAVVPDDAGNQLISRRSVQVLHADEHNAYVSGAIQNGDKVLVDGVHRVVSGQSVNLAAE
ncbi:efflux RND transporter periplasmic adaptor subunit [Grimontia sp. NTOU-MAR1]|uniref:efflux RND transporter periplasmic adaptor subunit n=1 Tax=Grimontia sp. NTOU-MAR1 TaxID=3111011 RepID=UPI002DB662F5|nr:efflux RND transporter periplasmic adaptor subunit [Grimontia sp. NTOU-MAR1]WRV99858.1 efflux RND transporter periplasmic adaptor subunit [Grimontia sp. NTOU-MAR1]